MHQNEIATTDDALVYMVERVLDTICRQATLKSKSKTEFKRQIAIAQIGCDWIEKNEIVCSKGGWINDIIGKCSVQEWSAKFEHWAMVNKLGEKQ